MWSNSEIQRTFVGHDLYRLGGSYRSRFCIWPNRKATRSFDDRVASNLAARRVRSRLAATASLSDHRSRIDLTGWRALLAAAGRFVAGVCIVCAPKPLRVVKRLSSWSSWISMYRGSWLFPWEENEENTNKYGNNTRTRKEEMCDKTEEP